MEPNLEHRFQDIFIGVAENWGFVQALRECFSVSLPTIGETLVPYLDQSIRDAMGAAFPENINPAVHSRLLQRVATHKVDLATSVVDSASVLVIQATMDAAVNDYLLLIADAEPAIWEAFVSVETVPMKTIRDSLYADILRAKATASAKSMGNKSLPRKVQWILDCCYRNDCDLSPSGFCFDIERLRIFDDLRHEIAHGRAACAMVSDMESLLLFLWQTMLSLQTVIGNRLDLKLDSSRGLDLRIAKTEVRSVRV